MGDSKGGQRVVTGNGRERVEEERVVRGDERERVKGILRGNGRETSEWDGREGVKEE